MPVLALTALGLGILGTVTSVIAVGAVLGVGGLAFGWAHFRRRRDARVLGWVGVGTSALAVALGLGFAAMFLGAASYTSGVRSLGSSGFESWYGKPAPAFEIATLEGGTLRLEELRGRRVILDFWATWCPPCVKEIPHFIRLHEEFPDDLTIVGISAEERSVLEPFVRARKIPYPVAMPKGESMSEPYSEVRAIPTTFFLDREGTIRHVAVGYHDYDSLRAHVVALDRRADGGRGIGQP